MIGRESLRKAKAIAEGQLSSIADAKQRGSVNKLGRFDTVIRNAAAGYEQD